MDVSTATSIVAIFSGLHSACNCETQGKKGVATREKREGGREEGRDGGREGRRAVEGEGEGEGEGEEEKRVRE